MGFSMSVFYLKIKATIKILHWDVKITLLQYNIDISLYL